MDLLSLLCLSFQVVLGEIAVLAHTRGVMRLVEVSTSIGHLGLSLSVVAVLAHVLGVVLSVSMWALVDGSTRSLDSSKIDLDDLVVLRIFLTFDADSMLRLSLFHVQKIVQLLIVRIISAQGVSGVFPSG